MKKAGQKRSSREEARASAANRAADIRARLEASKGEMPVTSIGGEAGWRYSVIPKDVTQEIKDIASMNLEAKGYELVTDGHVKVAGFISPVVYRIPMEIHKELLAEQAKQIN